MQQLTPPPSTQWFKTIEGSSLFMLCLSWIGYGLLYLLIWDQADGVSTILNIARCCDKESSGESHTGN